MTLRTQWIKYATMALFPWMAVAAFGQQPSPPTRTKVVVRGVANDGKLLDDSVGGVRVRITDATTGKLLAEGVQRGNSGDTDRIMVQPHARGAAIFDTPGAAAFVADLYLARPTLVRISATGPLKYPQSQRTSEKVLVVVPGKDVTGDGIVLQLNGLIVQVVDLTPEPARSGYNVQVTAHVAMMCGCPTTPGGIWDANTMEIEAHVRRGNRAVQTVKLAYAGQPDTYKATLEGLPPGRYSLQVVAATATHSNAGRDERTLTLPAGRMGHPFSWVVRMDAQNNLSVPHPLRGAPFRRAKGGRGHSAGEILSEVKYLPRTQM